VGYGYTELLGLNVLSGRTFSPDFPDSNAYIVNKTAAEEWLGVEEVTDQKVRKTYGRLVGIVKDFHMLPLYEPIQPMIMRFDEKAQRHILVKLKGGQIGKGLDSIQQAWIEFVPSSPPLYSFLDDDLDKAYRSELRMANIFGGFSIIAIILACLGLFGLSAYSAHRRVKEIGIRKVFGASIANLVALLSKDFIKLVLLGFLISTPIAWYVINRWLTDFQYKIEVDPWIFIITGVAVIFLALATVSWQSIRAAVANPADSLRSE
jgi:putative ABC transport system permease protein